jgi:hypothetical protein
MTDDGRPATDDRPLFAFFAVLGVFARRILNAKTPRTAKNAKRIPIMTLTE